MGSIREAVGTGRFVIIAASSSIPSQVPGALRENACTLARRDEWYFRGAAVTAGYPGNQSLPNEVKARVLATFRQTLDLYNQAALDDVIVGCDFLLKMDPLFEPAKKLRDKAKNPSAPIDLNELMSIATGGAPAAPPPSPVSGPDLSEARAALEGRDFQRAAEIASSVLRADMMNEEAQQIADAASARIEADPFIQQFAGKARQQLQNGDAAGARATMEKARSLDPDHPLLAEVQREINAPQPDAKPAFDPFAAFGAPQSDSSFGSFQSDAPGSFAAGNSFVVDSSESKPADTRGSAPASDFGFKFEEEQEDGPTITIGHTQPGLYGFAGGSAKEAAEATSADTFDFSTASVEVSQEDQKKIQDYLAHGDIAYEAQDYQKAIDVWSRVFLIDVTNDQASERIERARLKKLAIDTQIEDLAAEAAIGAEKKDRAAAKAAYQKILQLDPSNAAAIEQLALLDMAAPSAPPPPVPVAAPKAAAAAPAARPAAHPFDDNLFLDEPLGAPQEEILVPPDPATSSALDDDDEEEAAPAKRTKTATPAGRSRMMLFGVIGLVVLLAGGFAAWKFFAGGSSATAGADNTISRAQALAARGQYDEAIAMLLAIPPDHPNHEEALNLVAELKAKRGSTVGTIDGRPATAVFAERIQQGRDAFAASNFAAAKTAFEQASAIQPLPADAKQLYDRASEQVRRLETAENLFKSGNFVESIAAAETILQENPQNANAVDLITRAQFNLGVQALQEERLTDAIARFDQVIAVHPDDELARRAKELAVRYETTERDLLYRIFVKYLKFR
jgi:tetratricopeptide (TPR) repeat protein